MIDNKSDPGAWADAIAHSHCMEVSEYRGADYDAQRIACSRKVARHAGGVCMIKAAASALLI